MMALFGPSQRDRTARRLYEAIVAAARAPGFYSGHGVPDTLDGRFEMVVLHAFLVMRRLGREAAGPPLAQALFDTMFADFDASLRELGVGDISVGKRVKHMAAAYMGRIGAYETAFAEGETALAAALGRNVYGTVTPGAHDVGGLARYVIAADAHLVALPFADLLAGQLGLDPPLSRGEVR